MQANHHWNIEGLGGERVDRYEGVDRVRVVEIEGVGDRVEIFLIDRSNGVKMG